MSSPNIIFVLGGPGAGKGTQYQLLCQTSSFCHLSVGDILRKEVGKLGSKYGSIMKDNTKHGRVGPKEITIELLKAAINENASNHQVSTILIDEFPRKIEQAELFEKTIAVPATLVLLTCPEDMVEQRLRQRAEDIGRFDDNCDTIKKRIDPFESSIKEVIEHYKAQGKVVQVNGVGSIEGVQESFRIALSGLASNTG